MRSSLKDFALKLGDCAGLTCDEAPVVVGKHERLFLENIFSLYVSEHAYNDIT